MFFCLLKNVCPTQSQFLSEKTNNWVYHNIMSFRCFVCLSFNQMKGLFGLSLRDGDMLLGFFYFTLNRCFYSFFSLFILLIGSVT